MKKLKINKLQPRNNDILLTAEKYPKEKKMELDGILLDLKEMGGCYKLYQKVLAIGPTCRGVNIGDMAYINPNRYIVVEHPEDHDSLREIVHVRNTATKVAFPIIEVGGTECMLLNDQDIKFIFDGEEVDK